MSLPQKSKLSRIAVGLAVLWVAVSSAVPHQAHADANTALDTLSSGIDTIQMLGSPIQYFGQKAALNVGQNVATNGLKEGIKASIKDAVGGYFSLGDIAINAIGWIMYGINYFVAIIGGLLISIVVYGIFIILQLNGNVMNTFAVQAGFQVSLAVANLGFVLGIIIIAIATILHRQTYGIKSLLWKLVAAAILVNFSLIIGGVVINAANSLTTTFLAGFPGGGNGAAGFTGFADSLAGAFSPHRPFLTGLSQSALDQVNQQGQSVAGTVNANTSAPSEMAGSKVANVILPLFSVSFVTGMIIVMLITLAVFFFMLIVRYLYLTFLLILMPLAWLLWIFPYSSGLFTKWWKEFLRWTFFAPIVIFFLYLAIATSKNMSLANGSASTAGTTAGLGYVATGNSPILNGLSSAFGTAANTLLGTFLQMIGVIGLAVGGLYVADKLSITGAAAGMKAMGAVKNAAMGYADTWRKKGQRAIIQSEPVQRIKQGLQSGRYPIAPQRVQVALGTTLGRAERAGGADLAAQHAGWAKELIKNDPEEAKRILGTKFGMLGGVSTQRGMALVQAMHEEGELQKVISSGGKIGGKSAEEFLKDEAFFSTFNKNKLRENIQDKNVLTDEVIDAKEGLSAARASGIPADIAAAEKRMGDAIEAALKKTKDVEAAAAYMKSDAELNEMVSKLTRGGMPAADAAAVRRSLEDMRSAVTAKAGKTFSPQSFSNFLGKLERGDQLEEYLDRILAAVTSHKAAGLRPTPDDFFNSGVVNYMRNSPGAQNFNFNATRMGF